MKRIIVLMLALLAIAPFAMSAEAAKGELGLGGAMFLKSPVLAGQNIDRELLNVDQFAFGADARFKLDWFQVEGLLFCSLGDVSGMSLILDAGVGLDISIVRLSIGAGPNFNLNVNSKPLAQSGFNAKIGADVKIGNMSVGASYIMAMILDDEINIRKNSGLLGMQVLFWL